MSDLFRYTSGPPDAKIVLVGEAWGVEEERRQQPFVGESGRILNGVLEQANLSREGVLCTNIMNKRPLRNEFTQFYLKTKDARAQGRTPYRGLFPTNELLQGVVDLHDRIRAYPRQLVVALGNYPLWALTEDCFSISDKDGYKVPTGITSWRGSQLYVGGRAIMPTDGTAAARAGDGGHARGPESDGPGDRVEIGAPRAAHGPPTTGAPPLLPTYHPAAVMRKWEWRKDLLHDLKNRRRADWSLPEWNFTIRPSLGETKRFTLTLLKTLEQRPVNLAVDLETRSGFIACVGLAVSQYTAICIPLMCTGESKSYWYSHTETSIIKDLQKILTHPNVRFAGQNFLYDMQYIAREWDIAAIPAIDTMLAQHLCWPGQPKGLSYISSMYCAHHRYWKEDGKLWNEGIDEEQLWRYNCIDCVKTFEAAEELGKLTSILNLREQLEAQMSQVPMIFRMMHRGLRIDSKRRAESTMELAEAINSRVSRLEFLLPESVWQRKPKAKPWYRSNKQIGEILYDTLGVEEIKHPVRHNRTVDDEALIKISKREPLLTLFCTLIREIRSLAKFKEVLTAGLDPDKRMRCQYDPTGTSTFRWNSRKNVYNRGTNLQNLSIGAEE